MDGQNFLRSVFSCRPKTTEVKPSIREVTSPYALWKCWETFQTTSPVVSTIFAQVLMACPEITFAATTNGNGVVDLGLVDEDRQVVTHAMYSDQKKAWVAAGREVGAVELYGQPQHMATMTDRQVCEVLVADVVGQKLMLQDGEEKMGMTGPLGVRLVRNPDAFGGVKKYGCGKFTPPLFPWLAAGHGGIMLWSDVETLRREANRLTPRNLWDVIVCAAAGVPRGSTFE